METYRKVIIAASIIAVLGIGFFSYIFFFNKDDAGVSQQETVAPKTQPIETLPEKVEEPVELEEATGPLNVELHESDSPVRELAQTLSSDPNFVQWLKSKDLIRRIVAVTENIAAGESPANHLEFMKPKTDFQVFSKEGKYYISPKSYRRYNRMAQAAASIETDVVKTLYPQLEPLMQRAYNELGYPGRTFRDRLNQAVVVILKTPIVIGSIELEKKVISFAYKDRELEDLNSAQKHLLRMGPDNLKKIKAKLREIAITLELPVSKRRDLF